MKWAGDRCPVSEERVRPRSSSGGGGSGGGGVDGRGGMGDDARDD